MAKEVIYLTAEGLQKLKDELNHMRSVERPAISAAIAEARDKGDLSENAEYDAAREAQGLLEMRIAKLEQTLTNARVIDESKIDKSKVQILSKVTLLNHNNNKQVVYTIVSENEANLREGKLAIGTPIAKALLGRKKGDIVELPGTPAALVRTADTLLVPENVDGGWNVACYVIGGHSQGVTYVVDAEGNSAGGTGEIESVELDGTTLRVTAGGATTDVALA